MAAQLFHKFLILLGEKLEHMLTHLYVCTQARTYTFKYVKGHKQYRLTVPNGDMDTCRFIRGTGSSAASKYGGCLLSQTYSNISH